MSERATNRALPAARTEARDVGLRFIVALFGLIAGSVLLLVLVAYLLFPDQVRDVRFAGPFPSYPAPQLQPDPPADMRHFYAAEMGVLNGTGWQDRAAGTVHIPIAQAMQLLAKEGIPGWPTGNAAASQGGAAMIRAAALAAALLLPATARAQADDPAAFAWQTHRGAAVPTGGVFQDEAGQPLQLAAAFAGKPVILDLGYFHCPALCGVARADLLAALGASGLQEGADYALVVLSIDPAETPQDARTAKAADLAQARFATGQGWNYLTGAPASLAAVADAVGFRSRYDAAFQQYLHPTGVVVLTRAGIVSSYVQGVGYSGGDLRAAVLRAGEGGIAQASLPILLLCFHFDSTTGRYTLAIEKVLRLAAALTVVTLGGLMVVLHRKPPRSPS